MSSVALWASRMWRRGTAFTTGSVLPSIIGAIISLIEVFMPEQPACYPIVQAANLHRRPGKPLEWAQGREGPGSGMSGSQ